MTSGSVIVRPPSSGQHLMIGSSRTSKSSVFTTSWQGPERTNFGGTLARRPSSGSILIFSKNPAGGLSWISARISSAISSGLRPSASSMRRGEPKALIKSG